MTKAEVESDVIAELEKLENEFQDMDQEQYDDDTDFQREVYEDDGDDEEGKFTVGAVESLLRIELGFGYIGTVNCVSAVL